MAEIQIQEIQVPEIQTQEIQTQEAQIQEPQIQENQVPEPHKLENQVPETHKLRNQVMEIQVPEKAEGMGVPVPLLVVRGWALFPESRLAISIPRSLSPGVLWVVILSDSILWRTSHALHISNLIQQ